MGAVHGVKDKNNNEAAQGAALGALEAYLMEGRARPGDRSAQGREARLELERALYLVRE